MITKKIIANRRNKKESDVIIKDAKEKIKNGKRINQEVDQLKALPDYKK